MNFNLQESFIRMKPNEAYDILGKAKIESTELLVKLSNEGQAIRDEYFKSIDDCINYTNDFWGGCRYCFWHVVEFFYDSWEKKFTRRLYKVHDQKYTENQKLDRIEKLIVLTKWAITHESDLLLSNSDVNFLDSLYVVR